MSIYLWENKEKLRGDLERFRSLAIELGAKDAVPIEASKIVVGNWVRLKCQFGCGGYGKRFTCPPYSPTPEETQRMLRDYSIGLLVKFGPCAEAGRGEINTHEAVFKLEREIFLTGYYAAFGMACGPCTLCKECNIRGGYCVKPHMARPAMEACGIDVFATVRNAGFELKVLTSYDQTPTCFGLILIT